MRGLTISTESAQPPELLEGSWKNGTGERIGLKFAGRPARGGERGGGAPGVSGRRARTAAGVTRHAGRRGFCWREAGTSFAARRAAFIRHVFTVGVFRSIRGPAGVYGKRPSQGRAPSDSAGGKPDYGGSDGRRLHAGGDHVGAAVQAGAVDRALRDSARASCGSKGVIDLWSALHRRDVRQSALELVTVFGLEPSPGADPRRGTVKGTAGRATAKHINAINNKYSWVGPMRAGWSGKATRKPRHHGDGAGHLTLPLERLVRSPSSGPLAHSTGRCNPSGQE